jgi:DNA topoisomerase-1
MKLVICEKNIAARRIAYILSEGKTRSTRVGRVPIYEFIKNSEPWKIIGLKGHIVNIDFPKEFNQWKKVTPKNLIEVEPIKNVSEKNILNALKSILHNNPFLIVATDYDREGELIGVEAVNLIKQNSKTNDIRRAKFSAITTKEIKDAFDKLGEVDYNLSDAGEARQKIDLIWGAVLTRFISLTSQRLGREFLSIGRVQSPTLAILVEREKEIQNFTSKPYWKIIANLKKQISFEAVHCEGQIWNEKKAREIYSKIKDCKNAQVKNAKYEIVKELPPSPFNTTTLLQAASSLGMSASQAMSIAEELYMSGFISYPRTDNTVYPSSLNIKLIVSKLTQSDFAKEANEVLSNGRPRPTRGKKQTTDHPPIHPVGVPSGKKLKPDQEKIYELICRRFLATLAKDAVVEIGSVSLDISDEEFNADGYKILEANWRNIYPYFKEKRKSIPKLEKGETVNILKINLKEDKTKPPSRYNQGALIAKMEQLQLGTKSTRHEIISKLYNRKYITGSSLKPTYIAIAVIEAMGDCDVIKPKMTATLEEDMSLIAEGKKTLEETVKESRLMLTKVIDALEKEKESIKTNITNAHKEQNTIGKCPKCGGTMIVRISRMGKRFVGCSNYPQCTNTYSLPQKGLVQKTEKTCNCGSPVVKIKYKGKKPWYVCLNQDCETNKK